MQIPGTRDFKVKAQHGDKTFHVSRALLRHRSSWFKAEIDGAKFTEGCIVLPEEEETVERLLQHIYGMRLNLFDADTVREAVAQKTELDHFDSICEMYGVGKGYGVKSLEVATMAALRSLLDMRTSIEDLTSIGNRAFDDDLIVDGEVRLVLVKETAHSIKAVVSSAVAFANLFEREEYVRRVLCYMTGCEACEAGIEHAMEIAGDEAMDGQ